MSFLTTDEPWPGDIYRNPALGVEAGKADKENLAPMYDNLAQAIRKIDDEHLIFFEGDHSNE